jgi:hypothetical protein
MSYMGIDIRKLANAFVPRASPSDLMPAEALSAVSFSPNWLNRKIHDALEPIDVPAKDIRAVRRKLAATMAASFNVSSTK